jgi:putative membrane protein
MDALSTKRDDSTSLALTRTMLAHDRTLMAWVRTSTSLISFGFTIYKLFEYLRADRPAQHVERLLTPRGMALVMMGIGIFVLVLATIEYRRQIVHLRQRYHAYGPFHVSIALAAATMIGGLGVLGFVLVALQK